MHVRGRLLLLARDRILAAGPAPGERLRAWLDPVDVSCLEGEIHAQRWYPLATFDRVLGVLAELEAAGAREHLVELGRRAVGQLLEWPILRALEGAAAPPTRTADWWSPHGHLLVALPASLFSHSRWVMVPDEEPGRFDVDVTEAESIPASTQLGVQGALEALAERAIGRRVRVASERSAPDRIRFRAVPAQEAEPIHLGSVS
jgi:hypothetical protein